MLRRPTQLQIQMTILVTDLPVPRTIMLNLPEQHRVHLFIFQESHRKMLLRRPVARIFHTDRLRRTPRLMRLRHRHSKLVHRIAAPEQLLLPCIVRNTNLQLFIRIHQTVLLNARQCKRRNILNPKRLHTTILQHRPAAHHRNPIIKLQMTAHRKPRRLICHLNLQLPSTLIAVILPILILQTVTRRSPHILRPMALTRPIQSRHHHLRQTEPRNPIRRIQRAFLKRTRRKMQKLDLPLICDLKHKIQSILMKFKALHYFILHPFYMYSRNLFSTPVPPADCSQQDRQSVHLSYLSQKDGWQLHVCLPKGQCAGPSLRPDRWPSIHPS